MSYQDQYHGKPGGECDEHGNPIRRQTDQYGKPVHQGGTTGGTYDSTNPYGGVGGGVGGGDKFQPQHHDQRQEQGRGVSGMLHRSGSGSSSSSEDDGVGGRRKKGMKDKIKEKLPGGHKDDQTRPGATNTLGGGYGGGGYDQTRPGATTKPGGGYDQTAGGGYVDSSGQQHEKKGMMDKIKEKLPGQH